MKVWKRVLSLAMVSALAVTSLTACGGNGGSDSSEGSASADTLKLEVSDRQQEMRLLTELQFRMEFSLQSMRSTQTVESTDTRSSISLRMIRTTRRNLSMRTTL